MSDQSWALRPVAEADIGPLFALVADVDTPPRWAEAGALGSEQSFRDALVDHPVYNAVVAIDDVPVGLVSAYGLVPPSRVVTLAVALAPSFERGSVELLDAVLADLTRRLPLRQVLLEAFERQPVFELATASPRFETCGRLSEHLWLDGRYRDVHVLAAPVGSDADPAVVQLA